MITGVHWLVALVIAVAFHLAGMLWLSITEPAERITIESASDGIVVTLGSATQSVAEPPQSPETTPQQTDMAEEEAVQPVLAESGEPEPPPEEPLSRDPAPSVGPDESASAEAAAAQPVAPETVDSGPLEETGAVAPESADPAGAAQPAVAEPQAAASQQTADVTSEDAQTVAAEAVLGSAPASPDNVAVDEVSAGPGPPEEFTESADAAVVAASGATVEPGRAAPAEFADDAPVSESSQPPVTVRDARSAGAATTPASETPPESETLPAYETPPASETLPVSETPPASETLPASETPALDEPISAPATDPAPVEDLETARAERPDPAVAATVVEPAANVDTAVDVAAARPSAPEVREMSEPRAVETTAPETVRLQELQERSGGSGVVAHYAGVLKGWLQRNMHYPRAARVAGQEGDVVVRFVIDREGNVQSVELESGSGYPLLDREATEMVERGDPFPAMPGDMPGERLEVRVPVSFHVRDATATRNLPPIDLE
ncbi:MAG: TonB family protein [Gammaproteobacteria bacterium]|nr:TonB family protein [Gammaproteobacteria bacterium]